MATKAAFIQTLHPSRTSGPLRSKTVHVTYLRPRFYLCTSRSKNIDLNTSSQSPSSLPKPPNPPQKQFSSPPYRLLLAALYFSFAAFALFLGPGSPTQPDGELSKFLAGQFDETNDLFFALFVLMGGMGMNYAALLNAGAPRQNRFLPTQVFTILSIFIGFLGLGPYLIARSYVPAVSANEVREHGLISRVLENRWLSVCTVLLSLWCYAFALGVFTPGGQQYRDVVFYSAGVNLFRSIFSDRLVSTTCADFVILSTIIWGPLTEDMSRRGWFVEGRKFESALSALLFMLVPVLGPALYLSIRSPLPELEKEEEIQFEASSE